MVLFVLLRNWHRKAQSWNIHHRRRRKSIARQHIFRRHKAGCENPLSLLEWLNITKAGGHHRQESHRPPLAVRVWISDGTRPWSTGDHPHSIVNVPQNVHTPYQEWQQGQFHHLPDHAIWTVFHHHSVTRKHCCNAAVVPLPVDDGEFLRQLQTEGNRTAKLGVSEIWQSLSNTFRSTCNELLLTYT